MSTSNPVLTPQERHDRIAILRQVPDQLQAVVNGLTSEQLRAKVRDDEWSVSQIIHHLADAHMNSYIRTKRILAEDGPEQRPFSQENWVDMADETETSVEMSLLIIRGVHARWVALFESLADDEWAKSGRFRSDGSAMTIDYLLNSYADHSQAHLAQIAATIEWLRQCHV